MPRGCLVYPELAVWLAGRAVEWTVDNDNPLFKSIVQEHPAGSITPEPEAPMPSEGASGFLRRVVDDVVYLCLGHHLLVIVPVEPPILRNRKDLRQRPSRSRHTTPSSPSSSTPRSETGSSASSDGAHITHLSNEVNLLKTQVDRLHAIVERHHVRTASASITQPASTSYRSEIEPA